MKFPVLQIASEPLKPTMNLCADLFGRSMSHQGYGNFPSDVMDKSSHRIVKEQCKLTRKSFGHDENPRVPRPCHPPRKK